MAQTALLAGGLAGSVAAAEPFHRLKGSAIRARLTGTEITDEIHWALVLGKDGSLRSFAMGAGGKGTWRVIGDELCVTYGHEGSRCHEVGFREQIFSFVVKGNCRRTACSGNLCSVRHADAMTYLIIKAALSMWLLPKVGIDL